jgi:hypothetical protein
MLRDEWSATGLPYQCLFESEFDVNRLSVDMELSWMKKVHVYGAAHAARVRIVCGWKWKSTENVRVLQRNAVGV